LVSRLSWYLLPNGEPGAIEARIWLGVNQVCFGQTTLRRMVFALFAMGASD
jgi:hypothetical protein